MITVLSFPVPAKLGSREKLKTGKVEVDFSGLHAA
jgi:hypothetical protein